MAAGAPTAPLSLDDALRIAEERSRGLAAHGSAAAAARERAIAAGERPDPVLRAGVQNVPVSGDARFSLGRDFMTMTSLGVMQQFTRGDTLRASSARYEREAEAAEAAREAALAELRRDAALAWLERRNAQRVRAVLVLQRDEAARQVEAADAAYRGGRGAQADAFAARSTVAAIDDRIAEAEREIAVALARLARWIGPEAAARPAAVAPAADAVGFDVEALQAVPLHHPQIAAMARREAAARAAADVARAERQPDVSAEVMYGRRGPAYADMVSVNVSVPLPWNRAARQDRELAARLAEAERMAAEREEATRAYVAEALAMLVAWRGERGRLALHDEVLIPLAAARVRAATAAYAGNTGTLAQALDARRAEIDARLDRLRVEIGAERLWAGLAFLLPAGHPPPPRTTGPAAAVSPTAGRQGDSR